MDEVNGSDILKEIISCGILGSSNQRQAKECPLQGTASDAGDDDWNSDTDIAGLLAAIESCGILDTEEAPVTEKKRGRGRPKKTAMKGAITRESTRFSHIYLDHNQVQEE
jgi:hypothetical protein